MSAENGNGDHAEPLDQRVTDCGWQVIIQAWFPMNGKPLPSDIPKDAYREPIIGYTGPEIHVVYSICKKPKVD